MSQLGHVEPQLCNNGHMIIALGLRVSGAIMAKLSSQTTQ